MKASFDHQSFIKTLTTHPGVYEMLGDKGEILYIGKARNLKKRVSSYFKKNQQNAKTESLVQRISRIEIIITSSDTEALILENTLIKKHRPRYNVLFRDDKSYPYIYVSDHSDFPRIDFHRGAKRLKGQYFGPYPHGRAVREALHLIQKLFRIRQCNDTFFKNRSRPCIQYQIKRCTAPCCDLVSVADYQTQIAEAKLFLEGKNETLLHHLVQQMEAASVKRDYETAALHRNKITMIRSVQEKQYITNDGDNVDVWGHVMQSNETCIQLLSFRNGRLIGSRNYFPKTPATLEANEILEEFLQLYYLSPQHHSDIPRIILVNETLPNQSWLAETLSAEANCKIHISKPQRGDRIRWLNLALRNAENALKTKLDSHQNYRDRFDALQQALNLPQTPQRIECFDISHSSGEATVASCVVFNISGRDTDQYRRFNIKGVTAGDDYAAMTQALTRRYLRIKEDESVFPDLIMIDGGLGQLHCGEKVLENLQISGVTLISIAKGEGRKPGLETIYVSGGGNPLRLDENGLALHLLQQIRDEAHRFAITGHKQKRDKSRKQSFLEAVPGIGAQRRKALINYFGGLQGIKNASMEEIAKVPGISKPLAEAIYDYLRSKT